MRIIIFISGLFPIAAGIFFLVNEGQTFSALAFIAGLALLAFGLTGAFAYFFARRGLDLPVCMLTDSMLALVLAFIVLQNRILNDDAALSAFAAASIAVGAAYAAQSADMPFGKPGFRLAVGICGLLCVAMGLYGFLRPFLPEIGVTGILGGIFILRGVSAIAVGAGAGRREAGKKTERCT
jgi:uncharacterized membrane protein HdeD (DUF308 family)